MGEERIKKIDGTLYIYGDESKGITSYSVSRDQAREAADKVFKFISVDWKTGKCTPKFDLYKFYVLIGYIQWLKDNCPNKRVIHLIKHGKNERIRHKNLIRAGRIVLRRLEQCSHS